MTRGPEVDTPVAIVGGGVVGAAVAHALACRGVAAVLLEAEDELALGASGTSSGILHTGFDSPPGELETELILRSATLRDRWLDRSGVPVVRCGATLRPRGEAEARTVAALAGAARANGVDVVLSDDGALEVPGEAVTDPVAYTIALAATAASAGAEVRTGARVVAIERRRSRLVLALADGGAVACRSAVNCAGLFADDVARMAGDDSFAIAPRKGEFFVFDPPGGAALDRILLPVPTKRTKGVLAFPTVDGKVVVGPTAHDQEDKSDWTVRGEARDEVLGRARALLPALEGAEPVASYAGLRPAGRGANYVIGPSAACPGLVNVAAIRSTGLSASLGIGEHVAEILSGQGIALGPERPLRVTHAPPDDRPWWRRTALHRSGRSR
ncbi:MAG: glycerol-3-phosphate dehydrogenase [Solirubrobacteraceae bacterium]|nr:glycerol-3-phosphate dehydrogenase [Solirubrobacteraceae bacterium]